MLLLMETVPTPLMVFILLCLGTAIALYVFALKRLKTIHNEKVDQNIAEILEAKSKFTAEKKETLEQKKIYKKDEKK